MKKNNLFRNDWKDYLSLSNPMRKGLIILFSILIVEVAVLLYLNFAPINKKPQEVEKFKKDIDNFLAAAKQDSSENAEETAAPAITPNNKSSLKEANPFSFNPNNLPVADWERLGFSDKQIKVIKNYETKGGKFYSKADVKKIYSISERQFEKIEPYIAIPSHATDTEKIHSVVANHGNAFLKSSSAKQFLIVDLSTADTTELQKLVGIGPVKARIISNYREKLGGFYSINQLKEVWGINDSLFQNLRTHVTISDSLHLRKINLNTTDLSELKHPYLSRNVAIIIINFHKQHGPFATVDELRKVPLVDEELYIKIAHYLEIKN